MDFRSSLCSQVLPARIDWEGNVHSQSFEELVSMARHRRDMAIGMAKRVWASWVAMRRESLGPRRKVVRWNYAPSAREYLRRSAGGLLYPLLIPPPSQWFLSRRSFPLSFSVSHSCCDRSSQFPHHSHPSANHGALPAISRELINEYRYLQLIYEVHSRVCVKSEPRWLAGASVREYQLARRWELLDRSNFSRDVVIS